MGRFKVSQIDHVHVTVADREAAAEWYKAVLGLERDPQFARWAADRHGPLIIEVEGGQTALALFERPGGPSGGAGTIAFRVDAESFVQLVRSFDGTLKNGQGIALTVRSVVDHDLSLSVYFTDPDGNPIEVTTYERDAVRARIGSAATSAR